MRGKKSMNFAELKAKEIIDITIGKKLGFAEDIIIDTETNNVKYLRVPKVSRAFRKPEYREIPFSDVALIGEDVILIKEGQIDNLVEKSEVSPKSEFYYSPKVFRVYNKK